MIDRGFIKWQPFNSVISNKTILNGLEKKKEIEKPTLFPENIENLNNKIIEAYYSQSKINVIFYEKNEIKKIKTTIHKIDASRNLIELDNHKKIVFNQIININ